MPAKWTGEVVGAMHTNGIRAKELAKKLNYNEKYLSTILNGHRNPPGAEEKCKSALEELIKERVPNEGS